MGGGQFMGDLRSDPARSAASYRITNQSGKSPIVLVCDHASNHIPSSFGRLGVPEPELERHIAWDPGALPVCHHLVEMLDAALIESRMSRLVIDCNRPLDAPDLIPSISETTLIPGNDALSQAQRAERIALVYEPYHAAIERLVETRLEHDRPVVLVAIHSFTPVYAGAARPWHVGIIHDEDERIARPLIASLKEIKGLEIGVNEPYAPADRVYHTLECHARSRALPCVMIEIRNDQIGSAADQRGWAARLAAALAAACIPVRELAADGHGGTNGNLHVAAARARDR